MKIGILTLTLHTNYGGILQAYAMQTVLERMGHEVVVFDTKRKYSLPPLWKLPLCYAKRIIKICLGRPEHIFREQFLKKRNDVVGKNIKPFREGSVHLYAIRDFDQLNPSDYDAIVVGSDQVWRPLYFKGWGRKSGKIENAFLAFTRGWNIKRVAYAASFGTSDWEYDEEQTTNCKELLQAFDGVSVREKSGAELCREKFGVEVLHVLDPTMLLDAKAYTELFVKKNTPKSKGTLLNYVLDESDEMKALIGKVASAKGLKPFEVNNPLEYDMTAPFEKCVKISVEEWLCGFYDAEFVITDSFHACVFSIIFKKQFLVIGNVGRGMSRFESLLALFGLQDRMVCADVDLDKIQPIDYDAVYSKYKRLKDLSMSFLNTHLNVSH